VDDDMKTWVHHFVSARNPSAAWKNMERLYRRGDLSSRQVLAAFSRHEYPLDLLCHPLRHKCKHRLRAWLNDAVTSPVTQDWWTASKQCLAEWLA
jgi:hypothetical protein